MTSIVYPYTEFSPPPAITIADMQRARADALAAGLTLSCEGLDKSTSHAGRYMPMAADGVYADVAYTPTNPVPGGAIRLAAIRHLCPDIVALDGSAVRIFAQSIQPDGKPVPAYRSQESHAASLYSVWERHLLAFLFPHDRMSLDDEIHDRHQVPDDHLFDHFRDLRIRQHRRNFGIIQLGDIVVTHTVFSNDAGASRVYQLTDADPTKPYQAMRPDREGEFRTTRLDTTPGRPQYAAKISPRSLRLVSDDSLSTHERLHFLKLQDQVDELSRTSGPITRGLAADLYSEFTSRR